MKTELKPAQMRINSDRRLKLEKAALEMSFKKSEIIKYTDVVNYLIDNYLNDAKKDF